MAIINMSCDVKSKQFEAFLNRLPSDTPPSLKDALTAEFEAADGMPPTQFFNKHAGFTPDQNPRYAVKDFTQAVLTMLGSTSAPRSILVLIHNSKNVIVPIKLI